jgi:hypothetical protein
MRIPKYTWTYVYSFSFYILHIFYTAPLFTKFLYKMWWTHHSVS